MNEKAPPPGSAAAPAEGAGTPADARPPAPGTAPIRAMGQDQKPEERSVPAARRRTMSLALDEVGPLWDQFRAGDVVPCPGDAGSLALNVDGNNAYRLVCCQCGTASSWFEAAPAGIRLRTIPPGPDDETADI